MKYRIYGKDITKEEYSLFMGTEKSFPYIVKLYKKKITVEDVPEEIRDEVVACVNARIQRFGEYRKEG